jgi:hypothetical protein
MNGQANNSDVADTSSRGTLMYKMLPKIAAELAA